jgi:hypothetical protein
MIPEVFDCSLHFPGTLTIYGSSQAGKSTLVLDIIRNSVQVFGDQNIQAIYYIYTSYQEKFDDFKKETPLIQFIPSYTEVPSDLNNAIIVYDDYQLIFQTDTKARLHIIDVFQRLAHHNKLFCVCILQTIFNNKLRNLALNSTYQIYFPSVRDHLQITYLNREYFPQFKGFLSEVVRDVLKKSHGFMLLDCNRKSHERFRVRNFVIPHTDSKVYIPKENADMQ